MAKRPYFKTAQSVLDLFKDHPDWTSVQLGDRLGLHPAYIRAVLKRNGKKLTKVKSNDTRTI